VNLSFVTHGLFTNVAGVYAEIVLTANSAYHPDNTTSCAGYGKLMAFYKKATVIGSRIRVDFYENLQANGTTTDSVVGITTNTDPSSLTSSIIATEAGDVSWSVVPTGGGPVTRLRQTLDVSKFLDVPDVLTNPNLFSVAAGFPNSTVSYHVWVDNLASASTTSVRYVAEVLYDVVFGDPIAFT
jgi:hypothetical protein